MPACGTASARRSARRWRTSAARVCSSRSFSGGIAASPARPLSKTPTRASASASTRSTARSRSGPLPPTGPASEPPPTRPPARALTRSTRSPCPPAPLSRRHGPTSSWARICGGGPSPRCGPAHAFTDAALAILRPLRTATRQLVAEMIRVRREHLQILDPVVGVVSVQVVNHLRRQQVAPKVGLHHKAVLPHIASRVPLTRPAFRVRVRLHPKQDIAVRVHNAAPLPLRVTSSRARPPWLHRDPVLPAEHRDPLVCRLELICYPSVGATFSLNPRSNLIDRPIPAPVRMRHRYLLCRW